jgi:hypothetical protein
MLDRNGVHPRQAHAKWLRRQAKQHVVELPPQVWRTGWRWQVGGCFQHPHAAPFVYPEQKRLLQGRSRLRRDSLVRVQHTYPQGVVLPPCAVAGVKDNTEYGLPFGPELKLTLWRVERARALEVLDVSQRVSR